MWGQLKRKGLVRQKSRVKLSIDYDPSWRWTDTAIVKLKCLFIHGKEC